MKPHPFDPSYTTGPGDAPRCVCGHPEHDPVHLHFVVVLDNSRKSFDALLRRVA